ncbi:MAG: hypothetical protein M5U19_01835 [Microthrixaceae bacterium]|nr:hypothetical protein [Microthrixaceae bacterium]
MNATGASSWTRSTPARVAEAKWAIESWHRTLPLLAGAQAVVYDGAFRGTHLRELIKDHGVVPVSRMHSG